MLLGLAALNQVFGLGLAFGFKSLFGVASQMWNLVGSAVSILAYVVIIFLLQRYYEKRNGQPSSVGIRKFSKASAVLAGIAVCVGVSVVVLIIILAFSQL